jgi:nucleoside-diphosphate-sugar epimerase
MDITDAASMMHHADLLRSEGGAPGRAVVINAAGLMSAAESKRNPELYYRVNGTAVGNVLDFCSRLGAGGFIQLSSETVFGRGDAPFAEDGPRIPLHPYGMSKLISELIVQNSTAAYPRVLLRLPVVVGNGEAIGNPVSIFCDEATRKGQITLFNGGLHRRKFIAVEDVAGQIGAILKGALPAGVEAYNVGGVTVTMRELAATIAARLSGVCIVDKTSVDQAFSLTSTSEKISAFGYCPRRDLPAMIDMFLARGP